MHHNLEPVILRPNYSVLDHTMEWTLMGIAVAAAVTVWYFANQLYVRYKVLPVEREEELKGWQKLLYHKYYIDEIYDYLIRWPIDFLSGAFHKF